MDVYAVLLTLQQAFNTLMVSVAQNPLLLALTVVWGVFDGVLGFVEFIDGGKSLKLPLLAAALTVAAIALCLFMNPLFAFLLIEAAILLMIFFKAGRRSRKKERMISRKIEEATDMKDVALPPDSGLTTSQDYKRALECINGNRPRAAIGYLSLCRGKITGQTRFFVTYADALILLENYSGALAKLNAIPANRVSQKNVFKNVTVRKAFCHRGLNEYTKELECYDALLAKNIQPEVFYFCRSRVKLRMLEVCPHLEQVEQAIIENFGSRQALIESTLEDLDQALHYNKQAGRQFEGEILSYKGACRIHAEDYQEGWELLTQAKEANGFCANTYVYQGIYYCHCKKYNLAISALRKALARDKQAGAASDVACFYLAATYYKKYEYDDAIRSAAQSLSIFPYRSDCFAIQGDCYQNKSMYADAIKCYTSAIALKRKAEYYADRARCYYNLNGDGEKAYRDIQEALKLEERSNYRLAAIMYKACVDYGKRIRKDKAELDDMLAPFRNKPIFFLRLGIIYRDYDYLEESELYYRKALEKDPRMACAHFDLALLLKQQGRLAEAAGEVNAAIALEPLDVKYYETLAQCYRDMGDPLNEAETQVRLSETKRRLAEVNKVNGDAVYRLKRYQAAAKYYRAALECCPSAAIWNNLACVCYDQEQYDESIRCLEKALGLDRNYFLAYFNLGNCQLYLSETGAGADMRKAAEKNFQKALSLRAGFEKAASMLKSMDAEMIEMTPDSALSEGGTVG